MELTATRRSRPGPASRLGVAPSAHTTRLDAACRRVPDFIALMKPRVMALAVFTAVVGLLIAPAHVDPVLGAVALLAITAGAGAAGALNMWYDADVDALMSRTASRPIPQGRVAGAEALAFGLVLAAAAVVVLALSANATAAALLAFTIFFYIAVYSAWLKRSTPQNIVIGGAAGALPPVIGWTAATGQIGLEPLVLFLIIFLWTPPHFWALSLNRSSDYARAGVPMLPLVAGKAATKRQILIYSALLALASTLPCVLGFGGTIYAATAAICAAVLIALASQLKRSSETDRRAAHRLFAFSIVYLFLLFASLLIEHAAEPWSSTQSWSGARMSTGSAQAEALPQLVRTACRSTTARTGEV
jgi:heme o synthase